MAEPLALTWPKGPGFLCSNKKSPIPNCVGFRENSKLSGKELNNKKQPKTHSLGV
jgi:hypothetical protein